MDDSSIFITGSNGQLGTALVQQYPNSKSADIDSLDITNPDSVSGFNWNGIKYILNAAAYTNVDGAETDEGRISAWKVNATAVGNLVKLVLEKDITIVHISTDYVFDGTKDLHTETEDISPLSVYGESKAAGDLLVRLAPKHYIVRTSWVIGEGNNFVRTMLGLGEKGISPTVVADQIGRPTFTSELVKAIDHLLMTEATYGTYNASNAGDSVSWADITRTIFHEAGYSDLSVSDTTTAEYYKGKEAIAPRPLLSTLDLSKIGSTGFVSTDWHQDLEKYVNKELNR
jgi:dTDP-4-dehydrorhamnose 3,5-epimerase